MKTLPVYDTDNPLKVDSICQEKDSFIVTCQKRKIRMLAGTNVLSCHGVHPVEKLIPNMSLLAYGVSTCSLR